METEKAESAKTDWNKNRCRKW